MSDAIGDRARAALDRARREGFDGVLLAPLEDALRNREDLLSASRKGLPYVYEHMSLTPMKDGHGFGDALAAEAMKAAIEDAEEA